MKQYTSKVVICSDYAYSHGIRDIDNRVIPSIREIGPLLRNFVLPKKLRFLADFIPSFVKIPKFIFNMAGGKF